MIGRRTILATSLGLASWMPWPAHAQRLELPSGAMVRIWSNPPVVGIVVRANADTVVFLTRQGETTAVSLVSVDRVDISTHKDRHALKGAGIGALLGIASGFALGVAVGSTSQDGGPYSNVGQLGAAALLGSAGGLVGAGIGGVVGALITTDHWQTVYPIRPGLSLSIRLGSGHARIDVQPR